MGEADQVVLGVVGGPAAPPACVLHWAEWSKGEARGSGAGRAGGRHGPRWAGACSPRRLSEGAALEARRPGGHDVPDVPVDVLDGVPAPHAALPAGVAGGGAAGAVGGQPEDAAVRAAASAVKAALRGEGQRVVGGCEPVEAAVAGAPRPPPGAPDLQVWAASELVWEPGVWVWRDVWACCC